MCYKSPGPRCSNHARQALDAAQAAYDAKRSLRNATALRRAEGEFYTTPAGFSELKKQIADAKNEKVARYYERKLNDFQERRWAMLSRYHAEYNTLEDKDVDASDRTADTSLLNTGVTPILPAKKSRPSRTVVQEDADDYRMMHRAPRPGSIDDGVAPLSEVGQLYGEEVYDSPSNLPGGSDDAELVSQLRKARNNPDAKVTIYRALPTEHSTIRDGDWVALSKKYAESHARSNGHGKFHIIKSEVPASCIWSEGNSLAEWGYAGDELAASRVK